MTRTIMNEEPTPDQPTPDRPAPSPPAPDEHAIAGPHHEHPVGARRVKRRLMFSLIGLYAASILLGTIVALRNQPSRPAKEPGSKGGSMSLLGSSSDYVGWVSVHGPIMNSESGKPWDHGVEQWARRLRAVAETKGVRAIVLDINSPGGSVGAVQELYSQILRVRREKHVPVVALFDDVAASGGYYIATACDRIIAHPGTLTGSIGVIFETTNLQGLFGKIGLKMDPIKSGKHKDIGSPARPMTLEERKLLQDLIDDAYTQFVDAVAEGRKLSVAQVKPLADGRIYSGSQALGLHLVDAVGDSTDAVEQAAKLAGISGRPKVKRDAEKFSDLFEMLDSRFGGALLGRGAGQLIEGLAQPQGLQYRWTGWGL